MVKTDTNSDEFHIDRVVYKRGLDGEENNSESTKSKI